MENASGEAHKTIRNLNTLFGDESFQKSAAGILLTNENTGQEVTQIVSSLGNTSVKLDAMVTSLDSLIRSITREEGTVHYLATDTTLVRNIDQTVRNLEQGTARFNENMEALKHNFLTRGYFKKLERQEKREQKRAEK